MHSNLMLWVILILLTLVVIYLVAVSQRNKNRANQLSAQVQKLTTMIETTAVPAMVDGTAAITSGSEYIRVSSYMVTENKFLREQVAGLTEALRLLGGEHAN